jgi:hypothetical protein
MPRLRPNEFLCASSQLEDVCGDTGQRIGGDPPIPHRLIGAFFPMLEWSEGATTARILTYWMTLQPQVSHTGTEVD